MSPNKIEADVFGSFVQNWMTIYEAVDPLVATVGLCYRSLANMPKLV